MPPFKGGQHGSSVLIFLDWAMVIHKCPKRLYPQNLDGPDQSPGIIICTAQIQHPRKLHGLSCQTLGLILFARY
ncbi:hypothetical protein L3X38_044863 [Prunus dulcis]|uniref:Uncharacterized protein n=1 Tax=Prunus dulcis TaxID=3755 RepID=A0AAD4V156_PRUDU|nr:hypothetical protein L3X38_044863 [Prunus dulcis]